MAIIASNNQQPPCKDILAHVSWILLSILTNINLIKIILESSPDSLLIQG